MEHSSLSCSLYLPATMPSRSEKCGGKEVGPFKEKPLAQGRDGDVGDKGQGKDSKASAPPSVDLSNLPSSDEENEVEIVGVKPATTRTTSATPTPYKQSSNSTMQDAQFVSDCKSTPGSNENLNLLNQARDSAIKHGKGFASNDMQRTQAYVSPPFHLGSSKHNMKREIKTGIKNPQQKRVSIEEPSAATSWKGQANTVVRDGKVLVWQTGKNNSLLKPPPPTAGRGAWPYDYKSIKKQDEEFFVDDRGQLEL